MTKTLTIKMTDSANKLAQTALEAFAHHSMLALDDVMEQPRLLVGALKAMETCNRLMAVLAGNPDQIELGPNDARILHTSLVIFIKHSLENFEDITGGKPLLVKSGFSAVVLAISMMKVIEEGADRLADEEEAEEALRKAA